LANLPFVETKEAIPPGTYDRIHADRFGFTYPNSCLAKPYLCRMPTSPSIRIQTPGRICLFGDHQDYLELPVIACAINRYIWLEANPIPSPEFRLHFPDLKKTRTISLAETFEQLDAGDHLGAGVRLMRRIGTEFSQGYAITLYGNLPINAGVSSSSAVIVAWMAFLWKAYREDSLSPYQLGQLAYEAEVVEQGAPGGKMDQMAIAHEGLVYIDTREGGPISSLPVPKMGLVLAESGVPKSTTQTLGSVRYRVQEAVSLLQQFEPTFVLRTISPTRLSTYLPQLPLSLQGVFEGAVLNHAITQQAHEQFLSEEPDVEQIAQLMYQHHEVLRDLLKISVEPIDRIVSAAMGTGALGAKMVGSGGGGCVVAITRVGEEEAVAHAMVRAGARAAYKVEIR